MWEQVKDEVQLTIVRSGYVLGYVGELKVQNRESDDSEKERYGKRVQ